MSVRLALVSVVMAATTVAAEPPLEFHRVHVPAGRLGDMPLDGGRYVPLPVREFDAIVARAGAGAAPVPPATAARWRVAFDDAGGIVGTVACDVDPGAAGPGRVLPLTGLIPRRAVHVAEPPRDALVCGVAGSLGVATPWPGTYEIDFSNGLPAGSSTVRLPLVPALATSILVEVPAGLRPVLSGRAARHAVVVPPTVAGANDWRIDMGPAAEIGISLEPERPLPGLAVWSDVELAGGRATLAAVVTPAGPWRPGRLVLDHDQALRITEVCTADADERLDHESAPDGRSVVIAVPRWLDGRRSPLVVRGMAPATGAVWKLPLLRAPAAAWSAGGIVVRLDPALAVNDVETTDCLVVPPEAAAGWPHPSTPAAANLTDTRVSPVSYAVEEQGPTAACVFKVAARTPSLDVARVTTVEITAGAVLGRAACDVRATGGAAFEIEARVTPGWIIDSVDAFERESALDMVSEGGGAPPSPTSSGDRLLDWRVVPSPAGDRLRIGLAIGATAERGIGLRVAGHRGTLAPGAAFTTADLDMVRFDGEAADGAVIDLRTDADAFVEIAGRPAEWFDVGDRLAPLVEEGRARGRIRGGDRSPHREARLVRRRPPIDVLVDVRLEPRDDKLVQTFTFDCRTAAGLESLVIDFAPPGGDGLAWRVESPPGVAATARPLEQAEGGLASRSDASAASWLVELNPPPAGPVRLRAARTVPFREAVPVPLAWVEAASEPGGTVVVAAATGPRPRLVNHRLTELPTAAAAAAAQAEFAFGAAAATGPAAELHPAARGVAGRSWAWSERVSCWCEESGATEHESCFAVENEGRDAVTLALASGHRLEAVLVNGVVPAGVEFGPAGGTWRIPLPPDERRVEIVVRSLTGGRPGRATWRIDPVGCSLDVPVLDRNVHLLVPPGLVVSTSSVDEVETTRLPWLTRLTGIGREAEAGDPATGYRRVAVTVAREPGVLLVRRRFIAAAAILAGILAGIAAFFHGRSPQPAVFLLAVIPAVAALWVPPPFVPVARAAWWGALAGLACGWCRGGARLPRLLRSPATAACVAALVLVPPAAADDAGFRVFVTPDPGGDVALVPEPLFRALAAFGNSESAAVRVLACRIAAGAADDDGAWRMTIDVDADAGGSLVLDAGPGARWLPRPAAAGMRAAIAGREARLTAAAAGRQVVELMLAPAVERVGPVEMASARIPVAPLATLRVAAAVVAGGGLVCERAARGEPFMRAAVVPGSRDAAAFDLSAADSVRLLRPVDPRRRLASVVRAADTVNEVSCDGSGCRVEAGFDLDAGPDLVRFVVVRIDPRLQELAPATAGGAAPRLVPLGGDRMRVEFPEPVSGRARLGLAARLPLADPVGVFDVPGIWLDGMAAETRTIRLAAHGELDVMLDPPPPPGLTAAEFAARPPPRLVVRRPRQQVRGVQRLEVAFAPTGIALALEAQIDAAGALARVPIDVPAGCAVDRVVLVTDDPAAPTRRETVDAVWLRTAADRVLLTVQHPRQGRFRLKVEARLDRPPAPRGRLPVVRASLGDSVPLLVTWNAAAPLTVTLRGREPTAGPDIVEVSGDAAEPEYELTTGAEDEAAAEPRPAAVIAPEAAGIALAEVQAACDARGRVQGLARFDVVTAEPAVRLRLPPGMRLFDVLVDGRAVAAEPRAADAWDVPIGVAAWPRTIFVVFAGDAGQAVFAGDPLAIPPPRLEGLPAGEVLWSLRPPPGFALRVAPPARPLDAASLASERAAARDRIGAAFDRAVAAAVGTERERLVALAALRGEERGPAAEEAWSGTAGWAAGADAAVTAAARGPLVIRAVRATDGTRPARALATVVLVAAGGLAWTASARGRSAAARL